jgi:hypothetical protein
MAEVFEWQGNEYLLERDTGKVYSAAGDHAFVGRLKTSDGSIDFDAVDSDNDSDDDDSGDDNGRHDDDDDGDGSGQEHDQQGRAEREDSDNEGHDVRIVTEVFQWQGSDYLLERDTGKVYSAAGDHAFVGKLKTSDGSIDFTATDSDDDIGSDDDDD